MDIAALIKIGLPDLEARHGAHLRHEHWRALHAMTACRTGALGHSVLACDACGIVHLHMRSCGHRSCPRCQHHTASAWLDRQQRKLLPVRYFLVTFTLPSELRAVAVRHPRLVYDALFEAASATLTRFGLNRKQALRLGMCAVLHTHSRRLDYHPHVHVLVPGGGLDPARRQWRKLRGQYLFNARNLATVFRAKMLHALARTHLQLPSPVPVNWIVDCRAVGSGQPALQYLSRYLYRGVISEKNIVHFDEQNRRVTFRYQDPKTRSTATCTLPLADFLWRLMLHVLPTGFRRAREFGFLHGNAKRLLTIVQWVLRVHIPETPKHSPRVFLCPQCHQPLVLSRFVHRPTPET